MHRHWVTVKKARAFFVQNGRYTEQDRWERDGGLFMFTVATEIAALAAGANFAEKSNEPEVAADCWNAHMEDWFYVSQGGLAKGLDADSYYIRLNHNGIPTCGMERKYVTLYVSVRANTGYPPLLFLKF